MQLTASSSEIYIDQRADDERTEALAAIFTGAAGGPMAAFILRIERIRE